MDLKKTAQHLLGRLRCIRARVPLSGGVYVGKNVHFVNGQKISFGNDVSVRPNCDLFAGNVFVIHCDQCR